MILVVTWGRYLAMVHFFQNSAASINTSSNIKFVFRFWAWLLVVVLPTHWRWSKVSEMNCDKPARWRTNNSAKQRKVELEAICTLLPQETPPNDDDWAPRRNSRHFGRFLRQFGLHWFWHYPPPACAPVGPNNWKRVIWFHSHFFLFSLKTWFIVSRCSHLFWRRSISPSPSSRAPPHQKFPFPSENGNFTIFAAYQSNSRGGEMEMWK